MGAFGKLLFAATTTYTYKTTTTTSTGTSSVILALYVALIVILLASNWKIFTKAGKPGWAAIIPFYNYYVELEIIGRPAWWIILALIPFVNIIISFIIIGDLAKSFGKGMGFVVLMIFLPFIAWPMLAFGSAKYIGPRGIAMANNTGMGAAPMGPMAPQAPMATQAPMAPAAPQATPMPTPPTPDPTQQPPQTPIQ